MHEKIIVPVLIGTAVVLRIALRMRRAFGRQRVRPRRITVRIAIFAVLVAFLVVLASHDLRSFAAMLAGLACGAVLAPWALRHTRFESTAEGRFYTPHAYLGLAVTVLFLARIGYDFLDVFSRMHAAAAGVAHTPPIPPQNPLTLAISGAFVAYYLVYYIGILRRSDQPSGADRSLTQTAPQGDNE